MYQRFSAAFTRSRNLVQLLGWAKTRDSISIVSEYCRYGDLQKLMDRWGRGMQVDTECL
jgi:hypothetical protein